MYVCIRKNYGKVTLIKIVCLVKTLVEFFTSRKSINKVLRTSCKIVFVEQYTERFEYDFFVRFDFKMRLSSLKNML